MKQLTDYQKHYRYVFWQDIIFSCLFLAITIGLPFLPIEPEMKYGLYYTSFMFGLLTIGVFAIAMIAKSEWKRGEME